MVYRNAERREIIFNRKKEEFMQTKDEKNQPSRDLEGEGIYGVENMLEIVGNTPLHSLTKKDIQDYGELCDSDCQDCD